MSDKLKTYLKSILFILILFLLGYLLRDYLKALLNYKFVTNLVYLLLSFIVLLCATIILPITWYLITKLLRCELGFRRSIRIRLISEIGKYLPGRVLGYGYLVIQYNDAGQDKVKVLSSSIYEIYLCTLSSLIFFTIIQLFTSFKLFDPYKIFFILGSILGILSLHPRFFQWISDLLCKLFKRERIRHKISFHHAFFLLVVYIGYWLLLSIAFFLLAKAFSEIRLTDIFYLAGAYAISSFSGFLAFFLPAGLGAREAVLIFLLSLLLGDALGVVISLSSRIWVITCDLFFFLLAILAGYAAKRRKELIPHNL